MTIVRPSWCWRFRGRSRPENGDRCREATLWSGRIGVFDPEHERIRSETMEGKSNQARPFSLLQESGTRPLGKSLNSEQLAGTVGHIACD